MSSREAQIRGHFGKCVLTPGVVDIALWDLAGFGLDVELHVTGPDRRHLMAAMRNTNYYEIGLLHPKLSHHLPRLFKDGYRDGIEAIDEHGCVDVPEGPGLGVEYDWDFIMAHRTDGTVYK
jgi:L-alanine-DL-glutamate epimerase-like enolase superfamily enzyme